MTQNQPVPYRDQKARLLTRIKGLRLGLRYLEQQGAGGNSSWQGIVAEMNRARADLAALVAGPFPSVDLTL
jgi:hypothetical protein